MDLASQNELTLRELREAKETVRVLALECRLLRERVGRLEDELASEFVVIDQRKAA